MPSLQDKIDAIFSDYTQIDYASDNVNKALQEFREQIKGLNHIYSYPKYSEAIKDVLALLGEKHE